MRIGELLSVEGGEMTFALADDPDARLRVREALYERLRAEAPVMSDADDMRDHALGMIEALAAAGDEQVTFERG